MTEEMLWTGESAWCVNCKHHVQSHKTVTHLYDLESYFHCIKGCKCKEFVAYAITDSLQVSDPTITGKRCLGK
jgi:hypothetical protein